MDDNKKAKIESGLLTAAIMALLLLMLWYVSVEAPRETAEEGVEVAFGDNENGGGAEPEAVPMPAEPVTQAPPPTPQAPSENDLVVQDDEESLALAKQREEERKHRAEQQELIRKQREEQARLEAERRAEEQRLAEERARQAAIEQEKRDKAAALGGLFGNNQQGAQGSGTTQGASQQGSQNPVGYGSSNGNSWKLDGRDIKSLPKPSPKFEQEGKVVVRIIVNAEGKVIQAVVGDEGTTVSNEKTRQLAREAALKAEFYPSQNGTAPAVGTIIYTFRFN